MKQKLTLKVGQVVRYCGAIDKRIFDSTISSLQIFKGSFFNAGRWVDVQETKTPNVAIINLASGRVIYPQSTTIKVENGVVTFYQKMYKGRPLGEQS